MDISKASNFERFVFDLLGRDGARTRQLFKTEVEDHGSFTLAREEFERIVGFGFVSGSSTHADRLATIRDTWQRLGLLIDTHTADGLKVAREHLEAGIPMIVLETALPAKFAETIREAVGIEPERPAALKDIEQLPKRFTVMRVDAQAVKGYIAENV
jgi:threonine synthase